MQNAAAVINCAAYTNVDRAETEPAQARAVNADAVGRLGRIAARHDVHVIHISTDFVFDGTLDRPYAEDDFPQPLSVYGATKLAGEQLLRESGCSWTIVRVQWTYGSGGPNFISKFLDRAASSLELKMVDDQIGAPTWTRDVARDLVELLERRENGLFHYAADGYATRFEVARYILQVCGLERKLISCRTADFPAAARRPLNSRFNCAKIDAMLTRKRLAWKESLREFLTTAKQH